MGEKGHIYNTFNNKELKKNNNPEYFPHMGSQDAKLRNLDFVFYLPKTDLCVSTYRTISPILNSSYFYLKHMVKA